MLAVESAEFAIPAAHPVLVSLATELPVPYKFLIELIALSLKLRDKSAHELPSLVVVLAELTKYKSVNV